MWNVWLYITYKYIYIALYNMRLGWLDMVLKLKYVPVSITNNIVLCVPIKNMVCVCVSLYILYIYKIYVLYKAENGI